MRAIAEWHVVFILLLQHTHIFYHRSGDCNSKLDFFLHPMNKALLTRAGENQEAVTALPAAQLPPVAVFSLYAGPGLSSRSLQLFQSQRSCLQLRKQWRLFCL